MSGLNYQAAGGRKPLGNVRVDLRDTRAAEPGSPETPHGVVHATLVEPSVGRLGAKLDLTLEF
jgi:hypothetical protein